MKKDVTLYQDVADEIRRAIGNQSLRPSQKLPPILSLCERHGVSHATIRAALRELKEQGLIEGRRGSGVYVRDRSRSNTVLGDLNHDQLIACVIPGGEGTPFFAALMRGMERVARENGFRVLFANTNNSSREEARQLEELTGQVAGFLVIPVSGDGQYATYASLLERRVPFVFVDREVRGIGAPSVATDNELGGFLAVQHLLQQERGPVSVLAQNGPTSMDERVAGFERAVRESGRVFEPKQIRRGDSTLSNTVLGYSLVQELLEDGQEPPFGIIALNEDMARGTYAALKGAGLRIPDDVAVVGYDDNESLFFDPPLSAIRQDFSEMGARAVHLLLERLHFGPQGREKTGRARGAKESQIRFKPRLIVRNSSDSNSKFCLSKHFRLLAEVETKPNVVQTAA